MGNYISWNYSSSDNYCPLGTDCDTECLYSSCNSNSLDLDSLPTEILLKIATNLGLKSKVSLSTVSKRFRDIVLTQIVIDLKNLIHNSPEVCVDFEKCRESLLLRARVQSAIQKNILCFSHPSLLLKLARDYHEFSSAKVDDTQGTFFNWKWLMPSCTLFPTGKKSITISSCKDLERLAEYEQFQYEHLKMVGVCLEGHTGFFRGVCQHDYKPITHVIPHLSPSLRSFEMVNRNLFLKSSYSNSVMGNGAIFTAISKQCPLLDSVHLSLNTKKFSPTYLDKGVLGLDGFFNLLELKLDGNFNILSEDEYCSFVTRNSSLVILDISIDRNCLGNNILLSNCHHLQMLRLRCDHKEGECQYQLTYKWFGCQPNLFYLWIQCDLTENFDKFLAHLPLLENLKVLKFEEMWGFNDQHFYELMSSMSSLEVLVVPLGFEPEDEFWLSLQTLEYPPSLKEVTFQFCQDSYLFPKCFISIAERVPFKITALELPNKIPYQMLL